MMVIAILICIFFVAHEMQVTKIDVHEIEEVNEKAGAIVNIDEASYSIRNYNDKVSIDGWCVIKGKEIKTISIWVLLKDKESGEFYKIPTTVIKREDVTAFIDDGFNYDNSGFSAKTKKRYLNLNENTYEIWLLYEINNEKKLIFTGRTLVAE